MSIGMQLLAIVIGQLIGLAIWESCGFFWRRFK